MEHDQIVGDQPLGRSPFGCGGLDDPVAQRDGAELNGLNGSLI
jgi:hypothetical protein